MTDYVQYEGSNSRFYLPRWSCYMMNNRWSQALYCPCSKEHAYGCAMALKQYTVFVTQYTTFSHALSVGHFTVPSVPPVPPATSLIALRS